MPSSMAVSLNVFNATSSKWQEQRQVRWAQRSMYAMICQLSLLVETFSARQHLEELSWDIARYVVDKQTTFCYN